MTLEQIITYIVVPIFGAIGTIWVLIAKVIIPFVLKDKSDTREFKQESESFAYKNSVKLTETLVSAFINELEDKKRIEEMLINLTNERFRDSEIQADIDIMFHKLLEAITELRNEIKPNTSRSNDNLDTE